MTYPAFCALVGVVGIWIAILLLYLARKAWSKLPIWIENMLLIAGAAVVISIVGGLIGLAVLM